MTLTLKITSPSEFYFGKFSSFDEAISTCYQYQDNMPLEASSLSNIALSYANKKVPIAKSVVDKINRSHCSKFNLEDRMKDLVEFIRK